MQGGCYVGGEGGTTRWEKCNEELRGGKGRREEERCKRVEGDVATATSWGRVGTMQRVGGELGGVQRRVGSSHCFGSHDIFTPSRISILSLIGGDFAAAAVLISFGAVLGKLSLEQLVLMLFCEVIFYGVNEAIGTEILKAVDMGGSIFIHAFGAYFGLAVSLVVTGKQRLDKGGHRFGSTYTTDTFAMVGTLFLWMFWPSFNGALAAGTSQHRAVINTILSLTNSCLGAFLCSKILQPGNKLSMVDIQNATLAGGVAVGSSADLVLLLRWF